MIFAKINPPATKTYDQDAFNPKTVQAPYMCIGVSNMPIGAKNASFEIRYGILNFDDKNVATEFQIVLRTSITLTSDELATWGTDDNVLFDLIISKINATTGNNITITDRIVTDLHFTY